jgi:hypothetical protein
MGDKNKAICKWSKSRFVKDLDLLREIVRDPLFLCKDCGRVAHEKKWLCKPTKL